jgi:hypothetical protein
MESRLFVSSRSGFFLTSDLQLSEGKISMVKYSINQIFYNFN